MITTNNMRRCCVQALVLLMVTIMCSREAKGASGMFQALLPISEHDGDVWRVYFYDLTSFNGTYLGTIDVSQYEYLKLCGGEVHTYKNGGSDIYGAQVYWRVYPSDQVPGSFQPFDLPLGDEYPLFGSTPGDQRWMMSTSRIDIITGKRDGNYTLEVWVQTSSSDGTHYENQCGCNMKATFDIINSGIATTVTVTSAESTEAFAVQFQSETNIWYELRSTTNLPGEWTSTGARLCGNGGPMSFFDPMGYSTQKYYRVFILP